MMRRTDDSGHRANGAHQVQTQNQHQHFAADGDEDKALFNAMQARAARSGCTLHELSGGGYLVTSAGLPKECPEIRAVGALLRQIGRAA